ncbi:ATP-binding protein [soil metagenome]
MSDILDAMEAAVNATPDSVPLRIHYAQLLFDAGRFDDALSHAALALERDSGNVAALEIVDAAVLAITPPATDGAPKEAADIDWKRLEDEIDADVPPPFLEKDKAKAEARLDGGSALDVIGEVSKETLTLDDVGGMEQVKDRIRVAFLEPMRNPEIAKAFGKNLRGGLLLYGPPGTGKTFIARAVAGELGANFISVTLADVLAGIIGESEQNVHRLFNRARQLSPCVVFIDELDSLGGKRSQYVNVGWMRNVVNQILQEMDGIGSDNDGVFVLGATNHPWDVDTALLRPGRFDRTVLVLPPDPPARAAILKHHFSGRPIAGIDIDSIVDRTDGYSGADLEHIVATSAERAMTESIANGAVRPIDMNDVNRAMQEIKPSTTAWLQSARNVVSFANQDGRYDDLEDYLRSKKLL